MRRSYQQYLATGLVCLLTGTNACKPADNPEPAEKPYYQFTEADKTWFSARIGEEWTFETATGKRQSYRVTDVEELIRANGNGPIVGSGGGTYYYDRYTVSLTRLDTLANSTISFTRTLPAGDDPQKPPQGNGAFYIGGKWDNYIGEPNLADLFPLADRSLNFTASPAQAPLTVRSHLYTSVVELSTNRAPGPNGPGWLVPKRYVKRIHYDRQHGIVRMESVTGEIWDRVR